MLFKDVIGQEDVKQRLVEMIDHNRLSHALLFLGKEGSGALPLALAFAQYLTCQRTNSPHSQSVSALNPLFNNNYEETDIAGGAAGHIDSCGACPSCVKAEQLMHPDIHFSYPVITKKAGSPPISTDYAGEWREFNKTYPYGNTYDWLQFIGAENKQGNITAQECNDIIRKLNLKSFESGYKILVMWMPEYLGKEGNKLLKLIEEPPANTLFILVAESESEILSTILSRCQLVKIPAIEAAAVEEALMSRSNCPPESAKKIANISEGNYREALHLLQHADDDFHNLLREWLNATLKNQPIAQVKCIDELGRLGREKQKQFLRYFTHLLELAIRLSVLNEEGSAALLYAMSEGERDFAQRLNKICSIEQMEAIATELDKASYYIERNANARILFHALTIKVFYIVKSNVVVMG
jgi:DNA polymerase-3 subunit delta'